MNGCLAFQNRASRCAQGCGNFKNMPFCCADCINGDIDGNGNQCVTAGNCRAWVPESIAEETN